MRNLIYRCREDEVQQIGNLGVRTPEQARLSSIGNLKKRVHYELEV